MSGVFKAVGKIFKAVVSSPIFKVVLVAAAIYFTAGMAATVLGGTEAAALAGTAATAAGEGSLVPLASETMFAGEAATAATAAGEGALLPAASETAGVVDAATGATADAVSSTAANAADWAPGEVSPVENIAANQLGNAPNIGDPVTANVGAGDFAKTPSDMMSNALNASPQANTMQPLSDGTDVGTPYTPEGAQPGTSYTPQPPTTPSPTDVGPIDSRNMASKAWDWFNGLPKTAQEFAYKGLSEGAKAILQLNAQNKYMEEIQRQDAERQNNMKVPAVQGWTQAPGYHAPGIINTALSPTGH